MLTAAFLFGGKAVAQIPVEVLTGHKKSSLDIMFFRYFRGKASESSRFLFFNRNRVSLDHRMTATANLPQFGFTEAFSYNHPEWLGFAPVLVAQVFGSGFYTKAGVQYVRIRQQMTLFSWLVCETRRLPMIDFFFLGRYTPKLSENARLFTQLELINGAPTSSARSISLTQRLRVGVKLKEFQFGLAADFSEVGRHILQTSNNVGGFLRYEF